MFSLLRIENLEKDETDLHFDAINNEHGNKNRRIKELDNEINLLNKSIIEYLDDNLEIEQKVTSETCFYDGKKAEIEEAESINLCKKLNRRHRNETLKNIII